MAVTYNQADVDFVKAMLKHHQMAIDMGMAYYKEGLNPDILNWAIDITTGQMNEILKKKMWLEEIGESGTGEQM